jgi:hypothetical protein
MANALSTLDPLYGPRGTALRSSGITTPIAVPVTTHPIQAIAPPASGDGAIADQALAWLPPNLPGGTANSIYQSWRAQIVAALGVGILDPGGQYATRTGKCSGSTSPQGITGVQIAQQSLSIAGTGATSGLAIAGVVGAPIPIVGAAVAAGVILIQLFSKLFGPATSALEQKYLCPLVSSANAVLLQIVSEVNAGYITAVQAGAAFDSLFSSFHAQLLTPVSLGSGGSNALLFYNTPNDSQFMDSSLAALGIKYKRVWYPQLEAAANANKAAQAAAAAAQQAAAATALQAQINADVAAAVSARGTANVVPVASVPVQTTPATSDVVLYAGVGAAIAIVVLLLFL